MRHHIVCRSLFPRYRLPARIAELRAALALAYSDPAPYRPRLIIAGFTLSQPKSNYALPALGVLAIAALLAALWFGRTHTPTAPMSEGWAETTPFHLARRALAAVATETHVFVIGAWTTKTAMSPRSSTHLSSPTAASANGSTPSCCLCFVFFLWWWWCLAISTRSAA